MGRPSRYTTKLGDTICEQIAGGKSLVTVLEAKGMPVYQTVLNWLQYGEEGKEPYAAFLGKYVRAREAQADRLADETLDIADAARPESVAVAKLKIDTRKWYAGKLRPKKYGTDRTEHEVSGSVGLAVPYPEKQPGG